jgi:immune inhibitor A
MHPGKTRISNLLFGAVTIVVLSLLLMSCDSLVQGSDKTEIDPAAFDAPQDEAYANQLRIEGAIVPSRDLVDLTERFNDIPEVPYVARIEPIYYEKGDRANFWYKDHDNDENLLIEAILLYRSEDLNLWFEKGQDVDEDLISEAATKIEEQILPISRTFFGRERQPGIDGDPRVNILHLAELGGGTIGYFSQADEFVTDVNQFSNERELLYLSLERAPVASDRYFHVIAHEMQHMIHWNVDGNEEVWINEGLSELSSFLNGYSESVYVESFVTHSDIQLNDFHYEGEEADAHYGASFLFFAYFLEQYGELATRELVSKSSNGIMSIEQTLTTINPGTSFDDFMAQWLAANYLDGTLDAGGIYSYEELDIPKIEKTEDIKRFPAGGEDTVEQYGADYLRIRNDKPLSFVFTGTQQVRLVSTQSRVGQFIWSSYPADDSDMTLTRDIDLSMVDRANLKFWTWYELEEGWDYAYVAVSTDAGATWTPLETGSSTYDNPQGNSYGPAFTGTSGGGETPEWIEETADLSPFAGQQIQLRFEAITDDTVHGQGFVLDEISIPEIDFFDDFEREDDDWISEGFIRHTNNLPQQFIVQVILYQDDGFEVRRLDLDSNQRGQWLLSFGEVFNEAVVIIAGSTPVTNQAAAYQFNITEQHLE